MATLNFLKQQLRQSANDKFSSLLRPLSDQEYSHGFDNLIQDSGWVTYQGFIIPQLSRLLTPLFKSRIQISVLEIGPGPKSVLGYLPFHLRHKITKYAAFEPNALFSTTLERSICSTGEVNPLFPCLKELPQIYRTPFETASSNTSAEIKTVTGNADEKFDVVLFCHSMYGMNSKRKFIERAIDLLAEKPGGIVVVFHRDGTVDFEGLVCHQTASFPTGVTRVRNDDSALDAFASFITGSSIQNSDAKDSIQPKWRAVCRSFGVERSAFPEDLSFSSPDTMIAFTKHATSLRDLLERVPSLEGTAPVKNRSASLRRPAAVIQPTEIGHIQQCVLWALKNKTSLTIIGGGHSGHCLESNVVAVDMSAFDKIHILKTGDKSAQVNSSDLIIVESGCKTGDVIRNTFRAFPAPTYSVRNWVVQLNNNENMEIKMRDFNEAAQKAPRNCSTDAFMYLDGAHLQLGVTTFESSATELALETSLPTLMGSIFGKEDSVKIVDGVGLFETEMYMGMHGGHTSAKTSSFKRCLLLNLNASVISIMVAALEARPTPFCYLHLLHGGGAIRDIAPDATAFGCRDWDFACVVTGVWPRDQDGTEIARSTVEWVYKVAIELLPMSSGAYGADLGPDPRDALFTSKAFGSNLTRLTQLKQKFDPNNVLAHGFPLPPLPIKLKLALLVTGRSGTGKDYCAEIWAPVITDSVNPKLTARVVSISETAKREYSEATGADLHLLLSDRNYKERHRAALKAFFQDQVRQSPELPKEHFLNLICGNKDADVLIITGMRDEAPVSTLSHLVPEVRLVDVRVEASEHTREFRCMGEKAIRQDESEEFIKRDEPYSKALDYCPTLVFDNNKPGDEIAKSFARDRLLPFLHEDLRRLANMVRTTPDFPLPGVEFRHVLDIPQQSGGLTLSTSLFRDHFTGDWNSIDVVACCEAGGFIFASGLSTLVEKPLALIRQAGKLPPPTTSVVKASSYISFSAPQDSQKDTIELGRDVIPKGTSVMVVDDVLATGETLSAVLKLLQKVGAKDIYVMLVAEFPAHRGRELLRKNGFGKVKVQSLLVFDGA